MSFAPRILVCDDSIEEIRVLISLLRSANHELIIATNGRDACSRAGVLQPDLILLDVRMSGLDGLATCRTLKAHRDTRDIPVIFLTAANDLETRLAGLRLGACDFIIKPADEEEVLLRISANLHRPNQERPLELTRGTKEAIAVVTACIRLMEHDLSWTPTMDEMVQRTGISRHLLSTAFRGVLSTTLYGWLRERRLQQASQWLKGTPLSISSIAANLGFSTSANFATAFKARHGLTPQAWRQQARRPQPDQGEDAGPAPLADDGG